MAISNPARCERQKTCGASRLVFTPCTVARISCLLMVIVWYWWGEHSQATFAEMEQSWVASSGDEFIVIGFHTPESLERLRLESQSEVSDPKRLLTVAFDDKRDVRRGRRGGRGGRCGCGACGGRGGREVSVVPGV